MQKAALVRTKFAIFRLEVLTKQLSADKNDRERGDLPMDKAVLVKAQTL